MLLPGGLEYKGKFHMNQREGDGILSLLQDDHRTLNKALQTGLKGPSLHFPDNRVGSFHMLS